MASIYEALQAGLDHYAAGRRDEAAVIFSRILAVAPEQPEALHMAGVIAGQQGDLTAALDLLARAARLRPTNPDMQRNHAFALRTAGRAAAADAALTRVLPLAPADPAVLTAAAAQARRQGDHRAAWRRQLWLARLSPDRETLALLVNDAAAAGLNDAAMGAGRAILALEPDQAPVWAHLGGILAGNMPADRRWRLLQRALRLNPDDPASRQAYWLARRAAGLDQEYHSHEGQDALVHRMFFPDRRGGVFVDIGAYDGVTWSNSLYFERELGWRGLCVEASPARYADYCANGRMAPCVNVAVGDHDGEAAFLEVTAGMTMLNGLLASFDPQQRAYVEQSAGDQHVITVPLRRLDGLLLEHGLRQIDFLTVDVEGGEAAIIESLDPQVFSIDVVCLESHLPDPALRGLMAARGYDFVCRFAGGDEIFARHGLKRWGC